MIISSKLISYDGLDLLTSAVLILDKDERISYANTAAENLLDNSLRVLIKYRFSELFEDGMKLTRLFEDAYRKKFDEKRVNLVLKRHSKNLLNLNVVVTSLDYLDNPVLFEMRENVQQIKFHREERIRDQTQANKELIRNLAHEIKNPLGGIRGAAQLLEMELKIKKGIDLEEYTQVIIKESDRLKSLVDRFLVPHSGVKIDSVVNIHEVFERVRSVLLAEFPKGLFVNRDYDTSLPEFKGDKEQLIQAFLNISKNAVQAMNHRLNSNNAQLIFKSRIARSITIAQSRYKLALDLHIIDNGSGIPEDLKERIFYPLVSGKKGGTGLGLTIAQTFINKHKGMIEFESSPSLTDFRILIAIV